MTPPGWRRCGQVAQGLAELAEIPVLHRDLKPANVLDVQGVWKLADFGISRSLLESTDTYTFRGAGTLPYMAPELWRGQPATVKTDLYALGVLAFEVLTGARPFTGADVKGLQHQHEQEPPPPLPEAVPAAVSRLVLRLLAKDPAARPQDARAVLETIEAAIRRLSSQQEALRRQALMVQQRRSAEEADNAAKGAKAAVKKQRKIQALADFDEMMEAAADQAKEALPEAELRRPRHWANDVWELHWDQSMIAVEVWSGSGSWLDKLVLGGVVRLTSSPDDFRLPLANVICRVQEGRLSWSVLRFKERKAPQSDKSGPWRGYDRDAFDLIWEPMNPPWVVRPSQLSHPSLQVQQGALTAEGVVYLLRIAITRSEWRR